MTDRCEALQATVRDAVAHGEHLRIVGSGSYRRVLPRPAPGRVLDIRAHSGVVAYEPTERVVTVRAGMPIKTLQALLAEHDQMPGVEFPILADTATVGGAMAMGFSGVARPFTGAMRDFVLGVRMVNGLGEALSFGGQVMKNVAGYDISRLLVGSRGALGLVLEISLRVLPLPEETLSLSFEYPDFGRAIAFTDSLIKTAQPVTAATWYRGRLSLRFAGRGETIVRLRRALGGEALRDTWWDDLQAWRCPWGDPVYLSHRTRRGRPPCCDGDWLADWNGAKLWSIAPDTGADHIIEFAQAAPRSPLVERVRLAFDPHGVFQSGAYQ